MNFESDLEESFREKERIILEGSVISVDQLVSDCIKVPEGDYRILIDTTDDNKCVLVPTNEANKQTYEVTRPTLAGFFNAEVHKRVISANNGKVIAESVIGDEHDVFTDWQFSVVGNITGGRVIPEAVTLEGGFISEDVAQGWIAEHIPTEQRGTVSVVRYRKIVG